MTGRCFGWMLVALAVLTLAGPILGAICIIFVVELWRKDRAKAREDTRRHAYDRYEKMFRGLRGG